MRGGILNNNNRNHHTITSRQILLLRTYVRTCQGPLVRQSSTIRCLLMNGQIQSTRSDRTHQDGGQMDHGSSFLFDCLFCTVLVGIYVEEYTTNDCRSLSHTNVYNNNAIVFETMHNNQQQYQLPSTTTPQLVTLPAVPKSGSQLQRRRCRRWGSNCSRVDRP